MRLLGARVFFLLGAAPAHADPFGELPFAPLDGAAACIRPAAPALLSRWVPSGAELLAASPQGVAAQARVQLGRPASCPRVAVAAGSAVAGVHGAGRTRFRVRLRGAGGQGMAEIVADGRGSRSRRKTVKVR